MASKLDEIYADLTAATGIKRVRDIRLEEIAMDRALEAMYTVGTEGSTGIPHPIPELKARTFPLQDATASVHENAFWGYGPDAGWEDVTSAWMNSTAHRDNLERASDTHWGLGYHEQPPTGSQTYPRQYYILILTEPLIPLSRPRFVVGPGRYVGLQVTKTGLVVGDKSSTFLSGSGANYDARKDIDGKPYLHVVNGIWANFWVPESSDLYPQRPK